MSQVLKSAQLMVVRKRFDEIKPHPKNPRVHDEKQIEKLRHSIRTHGFSKGSIVIQKSTGYILAGHGIVTALKAEGYNGADVIEADLPDGQAEAFLISDNHVASQSEWDNVGLQQLINELSEMNIPSLDFGFDSDDLEALASQILADSGGYQAEPQDDEIPETVEPITQSGDLWTLGRHRVLCGDSTVKENVEYLLDGNKVDLCLTDPPYNVGKEYETYEDNKEDIEYIKFSKTWFFLIRNYCNVLAFTPGPTNIELWSLIEKPFWWVAWVKNNAMRWSKIGGMCCWEPICIYGKPKKKIPQDVYIVPITVQKDIVSNDGSFLHPTPKQIKLWCSIIDDFTDNGDIVLDIFGGSGTTLIACEKLGRIAYLQEIDAHYCDVIVKRYVDFVGSSAGVFVTRNGEDVEYDKLQVSV
jgi:hypothetical protein